MFNFRSAISNRLKKFGNVIYPETELERFNFEKFIKENGLTNYFGPEAKPYHQYLLIDLQKEHFYAFNDGGYIRQNFRNINKVEIKINGELFFSWTSETKETGGSISEYSPCNGLYTKNEINIERV